MKERTFRWGAALDKNHGAFLLGVNINIAKDNFNNKYIKCGMDGYYG